MASLLKTPIYHIISLIYRAPLWKMTLNKVNNFSTEKEVYKFQVACVSYLNLKQNKAFKDKIIKCLPQHFDVITSQHMRKTLKQEKLCVIALIVWY